MAKTKKLIVTKSTRARDITDMLPGDCITRDGVGGVIQDVQGTIKEGILHYTFKVYPGKELLFLFKLCKL
jgi:hypothetical protein